jgi:hypothetical protein
MKIKLVGALGLALLAASFTFSSSFACSQSSEATAVVLPIVVPESDATVTARTEEVDQAAEVSPIELPPIAESAPVIHSVDAIVVEITRSGTIMVPEAIDASEAAQTSTEEVDQPATVMNEIEPSPIDESVPSDIRSADAIVVEITQSVTIVAPEAITATVAIQASTEGSTAELDQPASVLVEPSAIDASTTSAILSADAIVVEISQSVTVAVPGEKSKDNEEVEHAVSTSPEHAATEPASIPDTETLALDGVN